MAAPPSVAPSRRALAMANSSSGVLPLSVPKEVNPSTDALELLKQAVALMVGDVRAEIHEAIGQLKTEASAAQHASNKQHQGVAPKLLLVAENLQHAEKDALAKMRELLTHSHWDLGQRLDQQLEVNAVLGDHLGASRDLTLDTVQRIEAAMQRLENKMSQEYSGLSSELERVKEIVTNISSQVDLESQAVQSHTASQSSNFEGRMVQQLSSIREDFEQRIQISSSQSALALQHLSQQQSRCQEGITNILGMEKDLMTQVKSGITEVVRLQKQDDKHFTDLSRSLENKTAQQDEQLVTLLQQSDSTSGALSQDLFRFRKKVYDDVRLVLGEIARVQKALQIDYLPPSTATTSTFRHPRSTTRKMSDAHRRSRDESALGSATVIGVQMVDGPGSAPSLVSAPPPHPHLAPPGGLSRVRTESGVRDRSPAPPDSPTTPRSKSFRKTLGQNMYKLKTLQLEDPEATDELKDDPPHPETPVVIVPSEKRYRDFGIQAETGLKDGSAQTDGNWTDMAAEKLRQEKKRKRRAASAKEDTKQQQTRAANFTPIDKLKAKATAAAMKKQYNVMDYYKDEGCAQQIARHPFFDNITILVVMANSIWLGIDTDLNKEPILFNAHPAIIAGENFFCTYFTFEILVRFLAFQRKWRALKDLWFAFDLFLALLIIVETWVTPTVLLLAGGSSELPEGTVLLRLIRLVRLVRLTRLTRLLRSFPELMIIVKGLAFAARSVCVFSLLWAIITYAFAIILRQLTEGTSIGTTFFKTVPESINTLLLPAVFGANAEVINSISAGNPGLWPLMVFFMALVSVTIMYMLLGVLVDVIGAVASTEKQKIEISYIVGQLREELEKMQIVPEDMALNQMDFQKLVLEPGIVRVMHEAGVNVDVLAEMLDLVWEDASKSTQKITFTELVNMVLGMRGSNPATVKDCKEQIRVTNSLIKRCFTELYDELDEKVQQIRTEIQNSLDNDLDFEGDFSWDGEHSPKDADEMDAVDEEQPDPDQDPDVPETLRESVVSSAAQ